MKIIIRIIGSLLAIVKFSTASDLVSEDLYLSSNIVEEVKKISLNKLLDFKLISVAIEDKIDQGEIMYGINTGIGEFSETILDSDKLEDFMGKTPGSVGPSTPAPSMSAPSQHSMGMPPMSGGPARMAPPPILGNQDMGGAPVPPPPGRARRQGIFK